MPPHYRQGHLKEKNSRLKASVIARSKYFEEFLIMFIKGHALNLKEPELGILSFNFARRKLFFADSNNL